MSIKTSKIGFIFDLDGTIVDSTAHYRDTWAELLREFGSTDDPDLYLGRSTRENLRGLLGKDATAQELEMQVTRQAQLGNAKMRAGGVQTHEGIPELIRGLSTRGVKLAIATAAEKSNAEWTIAQTGLRDFFETIVTDQDVAEGKPAPDIYLEAMRRLGVDAQHCAVMEDSPTGVRAAKAAGLRVIAVVTTHSPRALEQVEADRIIGRATELTADDVIQFITNQG